MIFADFNIICINQPNKDCFVSDSLIYEAHNRNNTLTLVYPEDSFADAHSLRGWWYTYWPNEALYYDNQFFDLNPSVKRNAIRLYPKWLTISKELLSFYISKSPTHTVAVVIRVQDHSNNIKHGRCSLNYFLSEMLAGRICYNELYFVTDNSD